MVCKGICHRYKAPWISQTLRYANGQKKCVICDVFVQYDGLFCPCCSRRLRNKPRTSKGKQMFVEQKMGLRKIQ